MGKKKILFGLLIVILVLGTLVVMLNWYLVKELERELENDETAVSIQYGDLSVNVLTGNASVSAVVYNKGKFTVEADKVFLRDLSYFHYVSNGKFVIEELEIVNPVVTYQVGEAEEDSITSQDGGFEEDIKIKSLIVNSGLIKIPKENSKEDNLHLLLKNIRFEGLHSNNSIRKENLPFKYENLKIESDSIFYSVNEEHHLVVKNLTMDEGFATVKGLKIVPRYSRKQFDQKIPYEKDRIDLSIDSFSMKDLKWDLEKDSLMLATSLLNIETFRLEIYRNKLLPDDTRIKPLYSEMLRELGIKLKVDTLKIGNSEVTYHEQVNAERPPGELVFSEVEAVITNLSNIAGDSIENKKTRVVANALFMRRAPLTMELEFEVQDLQDQFTVSGQLGTIEAPAINSFLKPAMNVEAEGVIKSLAYNFYGNKIEAKGEMQLSYEDFKVNVLKQGEDKKKSLLSGIVNLFIKNEAVNDDILQEDLVVERDQTKSFWNFLWLCIREGALNAFL